MVTLKANKRVVGFDLNKMRKAGEIPAVFYGAGKSSTPISIKKTDFKKVWATSGESSAIVVSTGDQDIDALIHEVQTDPVTDEPIHVDFLAIDMTKKIRVKVTLDFIGVSEAVKSGIGTLVKVLHEIEIEALPKDLPHSIPVDISGLVNVRDQINLEHLKLPDGVVAITPGLEVICAIAEQKEEVMEEMPVDLSQIEISEERGKKEEAPTSEGAGVPISDEDKNVGKKPAK